VELHLSLIGKDGEGKFLGGCGVAKFGNSYISPLKHQSNIKVKVKVKLSL
jgi:hypothetical protein